MKTYYLVSLGYAVDRNSRFIPHGQIGASFDADLSNPETHRNVKDGFEFAGYDLCDAAELKETWGIVR